MAVMDSIAEFDVRLDTLQVISEAIIIANHSTGSKTRF